MIELKISRLALGFTFSMAVPLGSAIAARVTVEAATETVKTQQGIGVNHGSDALMNAISRDTFYSAMKELGVSSYRIFGGMESMESSDDNGNYGYPSWNEFRSAVGGNPTMLNPTNGAYRPSFANTEKFSAALKRIGPTLQDLKRLGDDPNGNGMQVVLSLRNSANWGQYWVPRQNANSATRCQLSNGSLVRWNDWTEADWSEWKTHVVMMVYVINVLNGSSMRVDHWTAHNEPNQQRVGTDHSHQGWCGSKEQYRDFVRHTHEALKFAYDTFLGGRKFYLHGGALSIGGDFTGYLDTLTKAANGYSPSMIDYLDIHPYTSFDSTYGIATANAKIPAGSHLKVWLSEFGGGDHASASNITTKHSGQLTAGAGPGSRNFVGGNLWRLSDMLSASGAKKRSFYALKIVDRALGANRTQHKTTSDTPKLLARATRDKAGKVRVLLVNAEGSTKNLEVDLSRLGISNATGVLIRNDSANNEASQSVSISGGVYRNASFPPYATAVLELGGTLTPTPQPQPAKDIVLDASAYNFGQGVAVVTSPAGVRALGSIDANDYAKYQNIALGSGTGYCSIVLTLARPVTNAGYLELRRGASNGGDVKIADLKPGIVGTNAFDFKEARYTIAKQTGTTNLYLHGRGASSVANVRSIRLVPCP